MSTDPWGINLQHEDEGDVLLEITEQEHTRPVLGEGNLRLAVLEQAIGDFRKGIEALDGLRVMVPSGKGSRIPPFQDAIAWMLDDDATHPFAFVAICDDHELDAGAIRSALKLDDYRKYSRVVRWEESGTYTQQQGNLFPSQEPGLGRMSCATCGTEVERVRVNQRFCGRKCRSVASNAKKSDRDKRAPVAA